MQPGSGTVAPAPAGPAHATPAGALIEAITEASALLDLDGTVVLDNQAWRRRAQLAAGSGIGPARNNYLQRCLAGAETQLGALAAAAAHGIPCTLRGECRHFRLAYHDACAGGWYDLHVTRWCGEGGGEGGGVLVRHVDSSARHAAEQHASCLAHMLAHSRNVIYTVEAIPAIMVAGEAEDRLVLLALTAALAPDLVLVDIAMPGLNGLDATRRLLAQCPSTRVLILSMHQNEEYVRQALRYGAAGYLLKDAAPLELEQAIGAVMRGEQYLSPAVSGGGASEDARRLRGQPAGGELTARQREVLQLGIHEVASLGALRAATWPGQFARLKFPAASCLFSGVCLMSPPAC